MTGEPGSDNPGYGDPATQRRRGGTAPRPLALHHAVWLAKSVA